MNKWRACRLGDIAEMCLGKMLDKDKNKGELQPYLANINVRWGSFDFNKLSMMRFEKSESDRYGLKPGDLVVCEGGEPGRCAIWKGEIPEMKIQKALHRLRIKDGYSNQFVYYRFLLAGRNGELKKHFIGSTIQHLTGVGLKQIEFTFPHLSEQQKIAAVLSAFDAKIDLNNRINTELEAMAKTLYDYWFVQFDFPDKNGKPYKSSGGKMVYNPTLKREIPEGWKVYKLSNFVSIGSGYPFDSESFQETGKYKVITIKNVQDGSLQTDKTDCVDSLPVGIKKFCILEIGDVLMSLTGNVGRLCLVDQNQVLLNQRVGKLLCNVEWNIYFYLYFKRTETRSWLEKISTGSSQKNLSPIDAVNKYFATPPSQALDEYNQFVSKYFELIVNNSIENQQLKVLRDWLLPMLINGQVRVV
jgi:type I restriction enzyme, S subunit